MRGPEPTSPLRTLDISTTYLDPPDHATTNLATGVIDVPIDVPIDVAEPYLAHVDDAGHAMYG